MTRRAGSRESSATRRPPQPDPKRPSVSHATEGWFTNARSPATVQVSLELTTLDPPRSEGRHRRGGVDQQWLPRREPTDVAPRVAAPRAAAPRVAAARRVVAPPL